MQENSAFSSWLVLLVSNEKSSTSRVLVHQLGATAPRREGIS